MRRCQLDEWCGKKQTPKQRLTARPPITFVLIIRKCNTVNLHAKMTAMFPFLTLGWASLFFNHFLLPPTMLDCLATQCCLSWHQSRPVQRCVRRTALDRRRTRANRLWRGRRRLVARRFGARYRCCPQPHSRRSAHACWSGTAPKSPVRRPRQILASSRASGARSGNAADARSRRSSIGCRTGRGE